MSEVSRYQEIFTSCYYFNIRAVNWLGLENEIIIDFKVIVLCENMLHHTKIQWFQNFFCRGARLQILYLFIILCSERYELVELCSKCLT